MVNIRFSTSNLRTFYSLLAFVLATATLSAAAATTTYLGGEDFNLAGNWSAGVPGPADTAIINNKTAQMSVSTSVGSVQLSNGARILVKFGGVTFTLGGGTIDNSTIDGAGVLVLNGNYTTDSTCFIAVPIQTLNGSLTVNSGLTVFGMGTTIATGASINGMGGICRFNRGTSTLNGTATLSGAIEFTNGGFGAAFVVTTNTTLNGTLTLEGAGLSGTGVLTVNGALNVKSANTAVSIAGITTTPTTPTIFSTGTSSTGSIVLTNASALVFNGPLTMLDNSGMTLAVASTVTCNNTVALTNMKAEGIQGPGAGNVPGTFILSSGAVLTSNSLGTGSFPNNDISTQFVNQGTVNVVTGTMSTAKCISTGAINGAGGTFIASSFFFSGSLALNSAATISGAIEVTGGCVVSVNKTLSHPGSLKISGNGTLAGSGSLSVAGPFTVLGGLTVSIPTFTVAGSTAFGTGSAASGSLTTSSPAQILFNGSVSMGQATAMTLGVGTSLTCNSTVTLDSIGSISGNGTLVLPASSTLTSNNAFGTNAVTSFVSNAGSITSLSGTLNLPFITQTAGSLTMNGGNLGGPLKINGGTLTGAGMITGDVTNGGGTVVPGNAGIGSLNITGKYTQTAAGTLSLELGGATPGLFDNLIVGGVATYGGALNLIFVNGYAPTLADTLVVITHASRSGVFASVSAGVSGLIPVYAGTSVTLAAGSANPNPLPGITSLTPASAIEGSASSTLTVNGTNFLGSSVVKFNGNARSTVFVSATQLTATILTQDVATIGIASVTVENPAPGGGSTAPATFTINAQGGGGPDITSGLFAAAIKGQTFTYLSVATGVQPITYSATGLPAGFTLNSLNGILSGTPPASGSIDIVLTAQNSLGTDSITLRVIVLSGKGTNTPPTFSSQLTATPNPANVGQAVQLSAGASDADGDTVTVTWDFGDGTFGNGASVSHIYATTGVFAVTATISDGIASTSASLAVAVNTQTPANAGDFASQKGSLKFSFTAQNKDSLSLLGTLPLAAGTQIGGTQVALNFGDVTKVFTLNDKGTGGDKNNSIKISGKIKDGKLTAANIKFLVTLKSQNLFPSLSDFFTHDTIAKPGEDVAIPVVLTFDETGYVDLLTFRYTSTAGKGAAGVLVP